MPSADIERKIIPFDGFDLIKQTPDNPVSPFPILVLAGFASDGRSFQFTLDQISTRGYITLSPLYTAHPLRMDALKRRAILEAVESEGHETDFGVKQVNVVAHSKAAIDSILVAKNHPENFRNFVLVAPAGIHPPMNLMNSIRRLKEGTKKDNHDKVVAATQDERVAGILEVNQEVASEYKRSWLRYNLEGLISAVVTIPQYFQALREKGIGIAIIALTGDSMFPIEYFRSYAVNGEVDEFTELQGIHPAIKFDPKVSETVIRLIQDLEHKRLSLKQ